MRRRAHRHVAGCQKTSLLTEKKSFPPCARGARLAAAGGDACGDVRLLESCEEAAARAVLEGRHEARGQQHEHADGGRLGPRRLRPHAQAQPQRQQCQRKVQEGADLRACMMTQSASRLPFESYDSQGINTMGEVDLMPGAV